MKTAFPSVPEVLEGSKIDPITKARCSREGKVTLHIVKAIDFKIYAQILDINLFHKKVYILSCLIRISNRIDRDFAIFLLIQKPQAIYMSLFKQFCYRQC